MKMPVLLIVGGGQAMERRDRRGTQTSLLARDGRVEMRLRMGLGAKLGKSVQPYTSVVVSTAQHSTARPGQTRRGVHQMQRVSVLRCLAWFKWAKLDGSCMWIQCVVFGQSEEMTLPRLPWADMVNGTGDWRLVTGFVGDWANGCLVWSTHQLVLVPTVERLTT